MLGSGVFLRPRFGESVNERKGTVRGKETLQGHSAPHRNIIGASFHTTAEKKVGSAYLQFGGSKKCQTEALKKTQSNGGNGTQRGMIH